MVEKPFHLWGGDVHHYYESPANTLHLDHCEMWINPLNPAHLVLGNDGGLNVSYDKGLTWMHYNNIPTGEYYDITLDNQDPYLIYGGTQDDATVYGPAIPWDWRYDDAWEYLWIDAWSGGDGCVTQVDPEDPNIVYFSMQHGAARRKYMDADSSVSIRPTLPEGHEGTANFNFIAPYMLSAYDHKTLYHGGNYVFKSMNQGDTWEVISPDLAKSSDPAKESVAAGAIAESPLRQGLLYAGMDKGAIWVTRDDGRSWTEISQGLPNNYVRSIVPSRFSEGKVYVALSGINYDDLGCYAFVSSDYGATWESICSNLPDEMVNVLYEDLDTPGLIYAGGYRGVYISKDDGASWELLGKDLPAASVADMEIEPRTLDLVAATHGRGIYVMNLKPLKETHSEGLTLFSIPPAFRPKFNDSHADVNPRTVRRVPITYWSPQEGTVTLTLQTTEGTKLWTKAEVAQKGYNQFLWDLVVEENESDEPYFVHYKEYLPSGVYTVEISGFGQTAQNRLLVQDQ